MQTTIFPQPSLLSASSAREVKFPEDVQVILRADRPECGSLYLANVEAAESTALLQSLRVGAVMSVAKGRAVHHPREAVPHSKYLPVEEEDRADLAPFLHEGVAFIADKLRLTNVLVHCVSGTNRAACFAIAFLMRERALSLEDAYTEVKSRRKVISLSDRLLTQLKQFEREGRTGVASRQRGEQSVRTGHSGDRSIKIKTKPLTRSSLVLNEEEMEGSRVSGKSGRSQREDDDGARSIRSNRSFNSRGGNLSNLNQSVISRRNPEQSFISKRSKPPTILDRSFASMELPELPELRLERRGSSSRQEYDVRARQLQSKNGEINEKISQLHLRFESENQNSRLVLETQLQEITQLRNSLCAERRTRLSRIAHEHAVDYAPLHTAEI